MFSHWRQRLQSGANPDQTFEDRLRTKTNAQLMLILKQEEDYQPEAIEFVKQELEQRKIDPEEVHTLREEAEHLLIRKNRKEERLEWYWTGYFFLLPFGFGWIKAKQFQSEGFEEKYKASWRTMKFGYMLYLCLIALLKAHSEGAIRF